MKISFVSTIVCLDRRDPFAIARRATDQLTTAISAMTSTNASPKTDVHNIASIPKAIMTVHVHQDTTLIRISTPAK